MLPKLLKYKKRIVLGVLSILYVLTVSYGALLTHDDPTNLWIFDTILHKNGFFESLFLLFRNFDFNDTDYRSFWFPRVVHFLLFIVFRYWDWAYIAIIGGLHLFSGWLVYKVIYTLTRQKEPSYAMTLVWILNPYSAPLYVFHHYGYTAFPVIFLLLYILWMLRSYTRSAIPYLLVLGVVFSGEAVIPVLLFVAAAFFVKSIISRQWWQAGEIFAQHILAGILLVGHYTLLQQYKQITEQATRFQLFSSENLEKIPDMFGLWIQDQVWPVFTIPLSVFSSDFGVLQNGIGLVVWLVWLGVVILLTAAGVFFCQKKTPPLHRSWLLLAGFLTVLIPVSFSMYAYIILVNGGGGFFIRYAFLTGPLFGMLLIWIAYTVFRWQLLSRVVSGAFISYLLLLFCITHFQLKPEVQKLNTQIETALQEGREQGKKAILISQALRYMPAAEDSTWWNVPFYDARGVMFGFINQYYTPIQSPYKYFYSLDRTASNEFGYEMVSYDRAVEQEDMVILTDINGTQKEYLKAEVLVMGNPTFDYSYTSADSQRIVVCMNWECYLNSSLYSRVRIFSEREEYTLKPSMLDAAEPIYQEAGSEGILKQEIRDLPRAKYWVAFDLIEPYAQQEGQRRFRIRLDTPTMHYDFGPVDIVKLAGGQQRPVRILVETDTTESIIIQYSPLDDSDLPPVVSRISVYTEPIPAQ